MENLRSRAVAGGGSPRYFAAGNIMANDDVKEIYGMVQCSPDLSSSDCNDCIYTCLKYLDKHLYGMTNVYVGVPSCNVAYNLTRFYDSRIDSLVTLPPPPPSPLSFVLFPKQTNGTGGK